MFGIGTWELMLVLILALIVLGPTKLPGIAKSLGKGYAEFKRAAQELRDSIDGEVNISDFKESINDAKRSLETDIEFEDMDEYEDDTDLDTKEISSSSFHENDQQNDDESDSETLQTAENIPEQNPTHDTTIDQTSENQEVKTPGERTEKDTDPTDTSRDGIEDDNR